MLKHGTWVANARTRLVAANLAGGNVLDDEDKPTRDYELPVAHVSIASDQAKPDGDPRAGEPSFVHETVLTVTVIDSADNGAALKAKLVAHNAAIWAALVPDILTWAVTAEGIDRVSTEYEAPPEGAEVTGRVIVAFTLLSRTHWPMPDDAYDALPDLETISIDAGNGIGATIPVPTE